MPKTHGSMSTLPTLPPVAFASTSVSIQMYLTSRLSDQWRSSM